MLLTVITAGLSEPSSTRMLGDALATATGRAWAELSASAGNSGEALEVEHRRVARPGA